MTMTDTESRSDFTRYLTDAGALPSDALLGKIVFYTITDEPVAHADLEREFDRLGLDKSLMPHPIRELDAFKKATSDAKSDYPMSRDRHAFTLCRELENNQHYVARQITREIKDNGNKRLDYTAAIRATFYRPTPGGNGRVRVNIDQTVIEAEEVGPLTAVADQIGRSYDRYVNFHDGQKLRALVRNYLKALNGIEVKGGVYFVHQSKDDEVAKLQALVRSFGGGCMMQTIPMVDLQDDREWIASVFEREACAALEELARDTRDLMTARKTITVAAYQSVKAKYDELLSKAEEHTVHLQVTQDLTAASAEVALKALTDLQIKLMEQEA